MPSDSTKTLVDLREEVSFHVGGVKNPLFLFPAKKARDERWEVVHCTKGLGYDFREHRNFKISTKYTSQVLCYQVLSLLC